MATDEDVRRIIADLPETSEVNSAGAPYFRVGRRGFAKLRQEPEALVVYAPGLPEKEALILSAPDKYFTSPHYDGQPAFLVKLAAVSVAELTELLASSWRLRASEELLATLEPH